MNQQRATMIVRALLSVIFLGGYGLIVMRFIGAPVQVSLEVKDILIFLFGALTAGVGTIINYWFASSQSSADKDRPQP